MEVNATPSMKVAHEDPTTQQLIHDQKWEFVQDSFQLLHATQHTFEEVRVLEAGLQHLVDEVDCLLLLVPSTPFLVTQLGAGKLCIGRVVGPPYEGTKAVVAHGAWPSAQDAC